MDLHEKVIEQSTSGQISQPQEDSRSVPENISEKQSTDLVSEDDLPKIDLIIILKSQIKYKKCI